MAKTVTNFSHGLSVASGILSVAILDVLVTKEVIDRDEAADILQACGDALAESNVSAAQEAVQIIRNNWLPKYRG